MLVELGLRERPVVHLTSGVHGDEPAGPWALLSSVEGGLLDSAFAYRIWPCTNPSGYRAGTRVNADGNDVNRSFSESVSTPESRAIMAENRERRFVVAMDLHEDFEAEGFYCYEPVVDGRAPLSEAILEAIELAGFPLQSLDHRFDLGYPRDPRQSGSVANARARSRIGQRRGGDASVSRAAALALPLTFGNGSLRHRRNAAPAFVGRSYCDASSCGNDCPGGGEISARESAAGCLSAIASKSTFSS